MAVTGENQAKYEELFPQRFTSQDQEYQQYLSRPADPPPTVEDWKGRAGGDERGKDNKTPVTSETLQKYEELFAHRFTSQDQEYQQYLSRPADPPPIVEDWRGRAGGNQRGRDNRFQGHRGRGWGGDRGWGRDRGWGGDRGWGRDRGWGDRGYRGDYREQQRCRDRDGTGGHGSGYQSGPPNSNQGYNSHHQQPRYAPY